MAQRVFGIDLGSHSVKVAELEIGFRALSFRELKTFEVVAGEGTGLEASLRAVVGGLAGGVGSDDIVALALPGDRVLTRLYDFPISDPRKRQAVIANELADDIPWPMEEVVFDQLVPRPGDKTLVAVARREELRDLLDQLGAGGIEPRLLLVAPTAYGGLARRVCIESDVLLVDVGHQRTNVSLLAEGHPLFARAISRGGHQLTDALRRAFQLSYADAERMKHDRAVVVDDPAQLEGEERRMGAITLQAIAPLVREVRRTLAAAVSESGLSPQRVILCGGSAQLRGLDDYLAVELELPVERLQLADDPELGQAVLTDEAQLVGALSLSVALEHGRRQSLDLRQEEFAYRADNSFFREKALAIGAACALLVILAALNAAASLYALQGEQETLRGQLQQSSTRVLGKAVSDARRVSRSVKAGARPRGSDIPTTTAVDILMLLSQRVPARSEIKLDVTRLDIKPGKTYVRGTADSRGAVGKVIESLKRVGCFSKVSAGRISEVSEEKKQFSLTLQTKCF